jgi:Tfp pilus assembly ATPase PilU
MLRVSPKISDLFFSPGKPPLVEINGKLIPAGAARALTPEDTPAAEGWAGHIVSHRFKGSLG